MQNGGDSFFHWASYLIMGLPLLSFLLIFAVTLFKDTVREKMGTFWGVGLLFCVIFTAGIGLYQNGIQLRDNLPDPTWDLANTMRWFSSFFGAFFLIFALSYFLGPKIKTRPHFIAMPLLFVTMLLAWGVFFQMFSQDRDEGVSFGAPWMKMGTPPITAAPELERGSLEPFDPGGETERAHQRRMNQEASFKFVLPKTVFLNQKFGIRIDWLTSCMLVMVSTCCFFIHMFSIGYMRGDPRYHRFFGWIGLFTFAMLGLVLADNLLTFLIFWEIMGLCSYLLIGFYIWKKSARDAQIKAFIVTRIGDVLMILGIFSIFWITKSFNFVEIANFLKTHHVETGLITGAAILLFCGSVGKSAQFPLHVWLPDAMEGPTPVSALIHAATMVAAGVYLVARSADIFYASYQACLVVACIGGFTALFAATMGLVMYDIKKVLAYSTISQLGYMMLGLGVGGMAIAGHLTSGAGGYTAGTFHLMTHSFFKAGLFMGSGAVILGVHHEQDMRKMGGLKKYMPITYWAFLFCTLALCGIPPFAGFFSKDEVLAQTFHFAQHQGGGYWLLWIFGYIGSFLTAFYMMRLLSMTFYGKYRGGHHEEHEEEHDTHNVPAEYEPLTGPEGHHGGEPFEPHYTAWLPVVAMSGFAILLGVLVGNQFSGGLNWFYDKVWIGHAHNEPIPFFDIMTFVSLIPPALGFFLGYQMYVNGKFLAVKENPAMRTLHKFLTNKYHLDFFGLWLVKQTRKLALALRIFDQLVIDYIICYIGYLGSRISTWSGRHDKQVVDGAVNGIAHLTQDMGREMRPIQTGYLQNYGLVMTGGFVLFVLLISIWGPEGFGQFTREILDFIVDGDLKVGAFLSKLPFTRTPAEYTLKMRNLIMAALLAVIVFKGNFARRKA